MQVALLWPQIFESGQNIFFAHTSFKWANLASHNAGVSVVVVGISSESQKQKVIYEQGEDGVSRAREVENINGYLLNAKNIFVHGTKKSISFDSEITDGSGALDGGHLILDKRTAESIAKDADGIYSEFIKPYYGSNEFIKGNLRWCLWVQDDKLEKAISNFEINNRVNSVRAFRENAGTRAKTAIGRPHKFAWINKKTGRQIIIPTVFSEKREFITAGFLDDDAVISNAASIVQNSELYVFSIISSTTHMAWVRAISGKLEDRLRYTSATCYNTFPAPKLTEKNKDDLTRCADDILLAREAHFPATIAELYNPEKMPEDLRHAHERNDEVLERIYIGRRFKNDTERLEKLFELYTKMTSPDNKTSNNKKVS